MMIIGVDYHPSFQTIVHSPGDASAQEHCQGSDGTPASSSLVLDVEEWL